MQTDYRIDGFIATLYNGDVLLLACPTTHMNGTSKDELLMQLERASMALEEAYQALKQAAPHGRDYYVQTPNGFEQARTEHYDRLKRIDSVKQEIDAIAYKICS